MIYIGIIFFIGFPITCIILGKYRIKFEGPFNSAPSKDYTFETYHILKRDINELLKKYCN